jgi:single-strand DNA-binding protein
MLFTGRLTANAEVKAVKGDKQVINFTVAINQKWKNKAGEKKEKTAFVDCAYWRNSGIAEYLTKGAVVEVSGWMEAQGYQSKSDGIKARLNCTCDTIKLFSLTAKTEKATDTKTKKAVTTGAANQPDDDDLPF